MDQGFREFPSEGDAHEIQSTKPRRLASGSWRKAVGGRSVDPRIVLLAFLVELSKGAQILRGRCLLHLLNTYPLGPFPRAFAQKISPIRDYLGPEGILDAPLG